MFEDPGFSGKNTDRPKYQQMMERVRAGEFSHLLVWKIDRVSRNLLDFASFYADLKRYGVTFVSKNEKFDTSTAIGEAMLKIILVFAELERKMTAERVTAVMLSRANNGQWNGGKVPFGYRHDKETKTFSLVESEAETYKAACDLYEEKQSLIEVCRILNQSGRKTRRGYDWSPTTLSQVMTNIWYTGTYRYNVHCDGKGHQRRAEAEWINIENHHPALISEARYERFQNMLRRNRRNGFKPGDTYTRKNVHIFAGLLACGNCGKNITATASAPRADGYSPSVYGCSSIRKQQKGCGNKFFSDMFIGPFVFGVLSAVLAENGKPTGAVSVEPLEASILRNIPGYGVLRISGVDKIVDLIRSGASGMEYSVSKASGIKPNTDSLTNRLRKLNSSLQRLQSIYLYGDTAISEKDYLIERKRITDEIESIEKQVSEADEESAQAEEEGFIEKASYFLMVETLLEFNPASAKKLLRVVDKQVQKSFLNMVITRITVTNQRITSIEFKNGVALQFFYER